MSIRVVKAGALSSLQDLGRFGYQRFGVPVNGVMDEWSHRLANMLVGNAEAEATLECTLTGPSLLFAQSQLIAICGADLSPTIDKLPVPQGRPVLVRAGARLDFGKRRNGARVYLAVRGGYRARPVMHSKSTYLRGEFGGLDGRALRAGDIIDAGAADDPACYPSIGRAFDEGGKPFAAPSWLVAPAAMMTSPQPVRVIIGQQWPAFDDASQKQFAQAPFRISPQSDRMGYRMEGPTLKLRKRLEMISEVVGFGTVQVPPDGNPIILMADRQTTGGYPKIAQVASVDLPLLAQMLPHESLRFAFITVEQAQQLYLERERDIRRIQQSLEQLRRGK